MLNVQIYILDNCNDKMTPKSELILVYVKFQDSYRGAFKYIIIIYYYIGGPLIIQLLYNLEITFKTHSFAPTPTKFKECDAHGTKTANLHFYFILACRSAYCPYFYIKKFINTRIFLNPLHSIGSFVKWPSLPKKSTN